MVASAQRLCPQAMKAKMYFEKARLRSPCQKGGSWSRGNDGAENCYIWEIWGGFCYQICAGAAVGAAEPSWGFSTTVLFLRTLSRWLPKEDVTVEESDWVCSMPERILTIVQVVRCKAELHHQEQRRHRGPALKVLAKRLKEPPNLELLLFIGVKFLGVWKTIWWPPESDTWLPKLPFALARRYFDKHDDAWFESRNDSFFAGRCQGHHAGETAACRREKGHSARYSLVLYTPPASALSLLGRF